MKSSTHQVIVSAILAAVFVILPDMGTAEEDDLPQLNGELWKQQPKVVKQAWLVGVNNLIDAEYAYQMKFAKPKPTNKQTLIQRMYTAGDGDTINQVIGKVDAWYEKHPKELKKAVLDVLWLIYVKEES